MTSKATGVSGEKFAQRLLIKKGYKIIQNNFSCKIGEIDIIAILGDTLIFVEVKTRKTSKFGLPQEAVNTHKLQKIAKVGEYYTLTHPNLPKKKIDVVSIVVTNGTITSSQIISVI